MKRIGILPVNFLLMMVCLNYSTAADLMKGMEALRAGDFTTAFGEFLPLAERGDRHAQFNLGYMFRNGYGVPVDYKKAREWYVRAADQGSVAAQNNLGDFFRDGLGVSKDAKIAVEYYRSAARQGFPLAQNNLGAMFSRGTGVQQSDLHAYAWWVIAVSNGDTTAPINLNLAAKRMSVAQIEVAQDLAQECEAKKYTDCFAAEPQ